MSKTSATPIKGIFRKVCENLGWTISECDDERISLGKYSPAGEDFSFTADIDDLVQSVKDYAAGFDQDEHIEMWIEARKNGTGGVPSTRELVKDAEDIDEMLQELAAALVGAEENEEREARKVTFHVKFRHENSGNCTTTFKDVDDKRYFNRIHSNNVDGGKWCTVTPSGGYWESDTPVRPDVVFVVVDGDGNELFRESNADLGAFQSVGERAKQFAKEWAERLHLKTYEKWKRWLSDDERAASYGYIDNWLYANSGIRGTTQIGSYEHLGMRFGIMEEKMDHIICGKEWRYFYVLNMENNSTEAICGYIFEEGSND